MYISLTHWPIPNYLYIVSGKYFYYLLRTLQKHKVWILVSWILSSYIKQEQKNKKWKKRKQIHGSSPTTKRNLCMDPRDSKRCEYPNSDSPSINPKKKKKKILHHFECRLLLVYNKSNVCSNSNKNDIVLNTICDLRKLWNVVFLLLF